MTANPVQPASGASCESLEQRRHEPDASGVAPQEATAELGAVGPTTSLPEPRPLKALLWIFSAIFLGGGAVLAGTDLASPGFGFGLGAGMVIASLGCLGFLARGRFQAPPDGQRSYGDEALDAKGTSSFRPDATDGTAETESLGSASGGARALAREVSKAYRLFGLPPGASKREVRARYHRLAHRYHPDKATGLSNEGRLAAEQRMKEINAAYEVLQGR